MKKAIALLPLLSLAYKPYQIETIKTTFNKAKEFNLQYTMTAITIVESNAGKYKLNINKDNSLDCGVFMVNTKTLSNNKWKQARLCERLQKDYDFSFSVALERFKYFYNYWISKGYSKSISWKRAICSYNSGFNYKNGLAYYHKIVKTIKELHNGYYKKILRPR